MAVVVPNVYPSPDPAKHIAGSSIVGLDAGDDRDWTDVGQAMNHLRRFARAQPLWHQQWQANRFTSWNARSGIPPGVAEGTFRGLVRVPSLPLRTHIRVGVEATFPAGADAGLVEFVSLNSGSVTQIVIPAPTANVWFFDTLPVTWAGPTAPGFATYDTILLYTSSNLGTSACTVHAAMAQHFPLTIAAGPDGLFRPLDDLELDAFSPANSRIAQWMIESLQDLDDVTRYPRMLYSWMSIGGLLDNAAAALNIDLNDHPVHPYRTYTPVNGGEGDDHRQLEMHCRLGDGTNTVDTQLDVVWSHEARLVGAQSAPGPNGSYGPNSARFFSLAAAGEVWAAPQVGRWPDRNNVPSSPSAYKYGTLTMIPYVDAVPPYPDIRSVSVWGM